MLVSYSSTLSSQAATLMTIGAARRSADSAMEGSEEEGEEEANRCEFHNLEGAADVMRRSAVVRSWWWWTGLVEG